MGLTKAKQALLGARNVAVLTTYVTLGFLRGSTTLTTLGLIGETFCGVKLLLPCGKGKSSPAIGTLDGFFLISH
jgi:hypothetical protein